MYFELESHARHDGSEQYGVSFEILEQDDLYDTKGVYVNFEFRPEVVRLVWERFLKDGHYGPWQRRNLGVRGGGARIEGPRVLKGGSTSDKTKGYQPVFKSADLGGPLSEYAASLPHLEQMIEELEKNLPA